MENIKSNDCNIVKVVLIGESGVGKTCIIKRFTKHCFDPNCPPSLSSQFISSEIFIPDINEVIKFDLWDTAGQEKYRSLAKIFYKDAKIIIFVYEITNRKSFDSLKQYWYQQVKSNSIKDVILALVGNKSDLYNNLEVEYKEAEEWADSIGAIFQETSALSNIGIDTLFINLGKKFFNPNFNYKSEESQKKELYEKKKENKKDEDVEEEEDDDNNIIADAQIIKLDNKKHNKKKNKKCCLS